MVNVTWKLELLGVHDKAAEPEYRAAIAEAAKRLAKRTDLEDACDVMIGDSPELPLIVTTIRRQRPTDAWSGWTFTANPHEAPSAYAYQRIAAPHETPAEILADVVDQLLLPPAREEDRLALAGFTCPTCERELRPIWYDVELQGCLDTGQLPLWCQRCGDSAVHVLTDQENRRLDTLLHDHRKFLPAAYADADVRHRWYRPCEYTLRTGSTAPPGARATRRFWAQIADMFQYVPEASAPWQEVEGWPDERFEEGTKFDAIRAADQAARTWIDTRADGP